MSDGDNSVESEMKEYESCCLCRSVRVSCSSSSSDQYQPGPRPHLTSAFVFSVIFPSNANVKYERHHLLP